MKCSAILLAAGKGERYKGKKQDEMFRGKPLWRHVYDTAREVIREENIIVVGKDIAGGSTRTKSVIKGINALPKDTERLVILEAARPMVTKEQISRILEDKHPSVTYVRPLVNTVIYRDGRYVDRSDLYDVLTPQAFDFKMLKEAYDSGRFADETDDTKVMYMYHGIRPAFIETESNLFKVTYPGDMGVIESIYQNLNKDKD